MLGVMKSCKNLGHDSEGPFCIEKALEGYGRCCPYKAEDCHVVIYGDYGDQKIQCGGEKTKFATLIGVCQDFEPAPWLEQELLGTNDYQI